MGLFGRKFRRRVVLSLAGLASGAVIGQADAAVYTEVATDDVEIDVHQRDRNLDSSGVPFEGTGSATDQAARLTLLPGTAPVEDPPTNNANPEALIFRWSSLGSLAGQTVTGPGTFRITPYNTLNLAGNPANFGDYTVHEITGGPDTWAEATVTANSLLGAGDVSSVIGPVLDTGQSGTSAASSVTVADNTATIPADVIQRLIDGTSSGLLIQGVGATNFQSRSHTFDVASARPVLTFEAVVPEPASLSLVVVAGAALFRRRRRA